MNRNEIELFVKNYIRAYLLQIREQNKFSQEKVANLLDTSRRGYVKLESDESCCDAVTNIALIALLSLFSSAATISSHLFSAILSRLSSSSQLLCGYPEQPEREKRNAIADIITLTIFINLCPFITATIMRQLYRTRIHQML